MKHAERAHTSWPGGQPSHAHAGAGVGKRTLTMDLPPIQRKTDDATPAARQPALTGAPGGGEALPTTVRAKMERAFGADFSAVRIHQGAHAAALGALGYTKGNDIHFAPGQYQPDTPRGQELLGHELAHVVQQSQGRVSAPGQAKGLPINDDRGLEHEADQAGARAARGEPAGIGAGGAASGETIQMAGGETIMMLAKTFGVPLLAAATIYYLFPVTVTTALLLGGLTAVPKEWYSAVAAKLGIINPPPPKDPGTGGLGLGFGDLYTDEDAFGNSGDGGGHKVKGNLTQFRKDLKLTELAPPLDESQRIAALQLCAYPLKELEELNSSDDETIRDYASRTTNKKFVQTLDAVRKKGLTNLQLGEFCGCYLKVIEVILGSDGSKPVKRTVTGIDDKKPSSLSTAILSAMYREKFIRSNLAGFTEDQIAWARKTPPLLAPELAEEARKARNEDLRNDDCQLWNVMDKTSAKWTTAAIQISVWELATLMHTPELKAKTKFYNYNIVDKPPSKEPLSSEWVFTGMKT